MQKVNHGTVQTIMLCSDYPRPDLGRIMAPSQFNKEQKLPKMVKIIPNFLVLQFGENFMKIRSKIPKLQMHENLHKNVNENMLHLYTANFLCVFLIHLKWQSGSSIPNLMVQMLFCSNSTGPWP